MCSTCHQDRWEPQSVQDVVQVRLWMQQYDFPMPPLHPTPCLYQQLFGGPSPHELFRHPVCYGA